MFLFSCFAGLNVVNAYTYTTKDGRTIQMSQKQKEEIRKMEEYRKNHPEAFNKYKTGQNSLAQAYSKKVKDKIYANWKPGNIRDLKDFVFVTFVTLDKSGNIKEIKIVKNNAPESYKEIALSAIKNSAPFGQIPYLQNEYKFQCYMEKSDNSRSLSIIELK